MELMLQIPSIYFVIGIGAILGSLKSSLDSTAGLSICARITNFLLGVYCGVFVALNFAESVETGFVGLIALVGAMVGTNVLEIVADLAPDITKKYIKTKFKG